MQDRNEKQLRNSIHRHLAIAQMRLACRTKMNRRRRKEAKQLLLLCSVARHILDVSTDSQRRDIECGRKATFN
jgi:hypothetical protein